MKIRIYEDDQDSTRTSSSCQQVFNLLLTLSNSLSTDYYHISNDQ